MKKKFLAILLTLIMVLQIAAPAFTVADPGDPAEAPDVPAVSHVSWNDEVEIYGPQGMRLTTTPSPAAFYYVPDPEHTITPEQAAYYGTWNVEYFISTNKTIPAVYVEEHDKNICDVVPVGAIQSGCMAAVSFTDWDAGVERDLLSEFAAAWSLLSLTENVAGFVQYGIHCGVVVLSDVVLEPGTTLTVKMKITNPNDSSDYRIVVLDQYAIKPYTISFNANGGEGEMAAISADGDIARQLPANTFTRDGYEFAGWATSADGDKLYNDAGYIKKNIDITLYAKWNEIVPAESGDVRVYDANDAFVHGYTTVQDAIDAVPANSTGYTVKIMPESFTNGIVTLAQTLTLNKTFTLDLNGATLTKALSDPKNDKTPLIKALSGDVTIKNGTITYDLSTYTGTTSTSNANVINVGMNMSNGIYSGGTCNLTLNGVNVSADFPSGKADMTMIYVESGELNVVGSNLSATTVSGNTKTQYIIYTKTHNQTEHNAAVEISGSTVIDTNQSAGVHAIWLQNASDSLTISGNGVTINADATWKPNSYSTSYAYAINNQSGATCTIEGGKFVGKVWQTKGTIDVSGGYYSYAQGTSGQKNKVTVADGYEYVENTDSETSETYPYIVRKAVTYVAQIGETQYETLAEAIAEVPADGTETTIKLIADETIAGNAGVTIPTTKNVVLDLNGHTLKNAVDQDKASQVINNNGTLTIQDTSELQNGVIMNAIGDAQPGEWWSNPQRNWATNVINNCGTLNVVSGTIRQTANGSICYAIDNNSGSNDAIVNISGGTIKNDYRAVIRMFCNSTAKKNEINISGGTVVTNGSTAMWTQLPGSNAASMKKAKLNITGGTITGGEYAWYDYSFGDGWDAVEYSISGGMFTGVLESEGKTGFITGGTFSWNPSAYVAEGYEVVALSANEADPIDAAAYTAGYRYKVQAKKVYVAEIGETKYTTLAAAIADANATTGATIKLLEDIDFSTEAYAGYKWAGATYHPIEITGTNTTLDLNGHTISKMGNCALVVGHLLAKDGRVSGITIKNGTLTAGKTDNVTNSYVLGIAGGDNIVIENVTTVGGINVYTGSQDVVIKNCSITGTKYYTVCAQTGSSVIIRGTTYTKNTDNTVANKSMFWTQGAATDSDCITTENPTGAFGASSITIEDGKFRVDATDGGKFFLGTGLNPIVKGGIYNIDPSTFQGANCVAKGYRVISNLDNATSEAYPYMVAKVETTVTDTTSTTNDQVTVQEITYTDSNNIEKTAVVITDNSSSTPVNAVVVTTSAVDSSVTSNTSAKASEYVEVAQVLANFIETKNIAVADVTSIDMTLSLKQTEVSTAGNATIVAAMEKADKAFEIHPEATVVTKIGDTPSAPITYPVSNSELAENATFTTKLSFGADAKYKNVTLTHYATDGTVKNTWVAMADGNGDVTITLSSFSYVLGVVDANTDLELAVENNKVWDAYNFISNTYLNVQDQLYFTVQFHVSTTLGDNWKLKITYDGVTKTYSASDFDKAYVEGDMKVTMAEGNRYTCDFRSSGTVVQNVYEIRQSIYPSNMAKGITIVIENNSGTAQELLVRGSGNNLYRSTSHPTNFSVTTNSYLTELAGNSSWTTLANTLKAFGAAAAAKFGN